MKIRLLWANLATVQFWSLASLCSLCTHHRPVTPQVSAPKQTMRSRHWWWTATILQLVCMTQAKASLARGQSWVLITRPVPLLQKKVLCLLKRSRVIITVRGKTIIPRQTIQPFWSTKKRPFLAGVVIQGTEAISKFWSMKTSTLRWVSEAPLTLKSN